MMSTARITIIVAAGALLLYNTIKKQMDRKKLKAQITSDAIVVDVRSAQEFNSGHIDGALNIPHTDIEAKASSLDKGKQIIVYCRSGGRASTAQRVLLDKGFANVLNIGGYDNARILLGK
jgi:phage shock protein E